jgi:hypothetical protein
MKRILAIVFALAMTVAAGTAQAHHGGGGGDPSFRHHHHHHFVVGTNASFSGSKNDDGTFTGDLTLTLKHHGGMARASHHGGGGDNPGTDEPVTKTFHLENARVKFADSITDANGDGSVDFSDVQSTDVVVLKLARHSHGAKARRSCHNGGDTSSDAGIQKAFVFRPQAKSD